MMLMSLRVVLTSMTLMMPMLKAMQHLLERTKNDRNITCAAQKVAAGVC